MNSQLPSPTGALPARQTVWLGFRVEPSGQPYLFNAKDAFEVQLARLMSVAVASRVTQLVSADLKSFTEAGFPEEALLQLEFLDNRMVGVRPLKA